MRTFVPLVLGTLAVVMIAVTPAQESAANLEDALRRAVPGDVVPLGFDSLPGETILNRAPKQLVPLSGGLLYSDNPETVEEFGILYQDTPSESLHRVYLYHVNGTDLPARITVAIENVGSFSANLLFGRRAVPTPSQNYLAVGLAAVRAFLESSPAAGTGRLAPGEAALLNPRLDGQVVAPGELAHFIGDISSDQPLRITTLMIPATAETLDVLPELEFAANDEFGRQGTFETNAFLTIDPHAYDTADGIRRLSIANQFLPEANPPIEGIDAETGEPTTLRGNYGVTYSIQIVLTSSEGRAVALLVNPRGGPHRGHFRTTFPEGSAAVGIDVPADSTVSEQGEAGLIETFQPTVTPQTLTLEFIPTGASALPIDLLLVPFDAMEAEPSTDSPVAAPD